MTGNQRHKHYKNSHIDLAVKELDGYRLRKQQIMRLKERKLQLEDELYSVKAVDYSKDKVQGGKFKDGLVDATLEWATLDDKIHKLIVENEQEMLVIEEKIKRLRFDEQQVLVYYYINGKNMTAISIKMERSVDGLKKLKKRALAHYAESFENPQEFFEVEK